jgi:hypothetical protein
MKPSHLKPAPPRRYLVEVPWVETRGVRALRSRHNEGALAALHSILAGLMCGTKRGARYWLETAQGQLEDAGNAIKKRRARRTRNKRP